jgi:tetratricopeptide (TPR) repeat protein
MKADFYTEKAFQEIQAMEKEGNINLLTMKAVQDYAKLRHVKPELMKRLSWYLDKFRQYLSRETIQALNSLPAEDLRTFNLLEKIDSLKNSVAMPACGRIFFPTATTTRGHIYEINILKEKIKGFLPLRLHLLDQVGSHVYSVLQESVQWTLFWDPGQFSFQILDTFGREDTAVSGESMGLPLALALYSLETKRELPVNISATAAVKRDGSIEPVEGLEEKLAALRRERHFVDTVFVSQRQEMNFTLNGLKIVKVGRLKDAITEAFPGPVDPSIFPSRIDVKTEISGIQKQYSDYLIDTCLDNALKLTRYLEAKDCPVSKEKAAEDLFTCYWRRGSCYCHKGQVELTKQNLNKAEAIYKRYKGTIRPHRYLNEEINHGVHLKDIFRYKEAEDLHRAIASEAETITGVDNEKAKNLSSLSQLYLAQQRFNEAADLQNKAIRLFTKSERHRNYNYLGLIYTRSGDFQKAARAFRQTFNLLEEADSDTRKKGLPFYHLYFSEYLYQTGTNKKRGARKRLQELHEIAGRYPEITWYVPALIHKFSGCALLFEGEENKGLNVLEKVIHFFDSQFDAMHRLLGVTVRAERTLYLLKSGQIEEATPAIKKIKESLCMQKDIKLFFNEEIRAFSHFLRVKHLDKHHVKELCHNIEGLKEKIPY